MKKLAIIVLLSVTLVVALPINDDSLEDEDFEDGWFVPQANGSLVWITEEQAQLKMRSLTMGRKKSKAAVVKFYLYVNSDPEFPTEIFVDDADSLRNGGFDNQHPTRIIIHGWQNNYQSDVNTEIRDAIFSVQDMNVISVDWSDKADVYNYFSAVSYIPEVGQRVADLIEFLRDEGGMESEDLKVIGHSLGAHVSGYAGKLITGEPIHVIIGLDTAFPLFNYKKCEERLCKTDANYVESIHTNGRLLGFIQPIGHADFYPNGGKKQPGCGLDVTGSCSHARAYIYYAEGIRQDFFGLKCNSWKEAVKKSCGGLQNYSNVARLGSKVVRMDVKGAFYSAVNKEAPFFNGIQS